MSLTKKIVAPTLDEMLQAQARDRARLEYELRGQLNRVRAATDEPYPVKEFEARRGWFQKLIQSITGK